MKIDKEKMIESMKMGQVVVLNILPKSDYKKLHIKGSESHPFADDPVSFIKEVEVNYGKKKSFILYGDHFGLLDSFLAAKALEDHGFQALNYPGGLREWYRAGLPVEGTEADAVCASLPAVAQ
jgi:rhodanese-related sulfurtransferase